MKGNTWTGILFLLVGTVLLLKQMGYPFPSWLFTWEMIVITIGIFIGVHNRFRDFSWLVLVLIGLVFLSDDIWPDFRLKQYALPVIVIALGLIFLLAPKLMCRGRRRNRMHRRGRCFRSRWKEDLPATPNTSVSGESALDIVSVFSGVKKRILSKQFQGGEIVCIFGGAEVNLANADFNSAITLDLVQIFGGTKLVVPANWEVRSEIAAVFGGVDDKRPQPVAAVPEKTVILKGTVIFGGVEVSSF